MLLPRNVLIRMGMWCTLLIVSGAPLATIMFVRNINYLLDGKQTILLPLSDNNFRQDNNFWQENQCIIQMLLSLSVFLLCFATGQFANEQYEELWTKIFSFIFCRPTKRGTIFEIVHPPSLQYSFNQIGSITSSKSSKSHSISMPDTAMKHRNTSSYPSPSIQNMGESTHDRERTTSTVVLIPLHTDIPFPEPAKISPS